MKRLKKGPELKMPELKVPNFLVDLYYDLRDRRLLPLVALALVAIVAVPFLLGGDSEEEPATPSGAVEAPSAEAVGSAKLAVVEAKPGLRDYRKRLERRQATDPFEQRYSSPVLKDTQLGSDGETSSSSSTSVTRTSTSVTKTTKTTDGDTTTTTTTTDTADGTPDGLVLYSFAANIKIVRISTKPDGSKEKQLSTRDHVLPPAALPSEQSQVVTYLGISPKSQNPLLLISDSVTGVYGDAECISGSSSCQLVEVEVGFPVTFVGPDDVRYKINILDVNAVVAGEVGSEQE